MKGGQYMKHIVFYSGGIGSYFTAKRVIEKYGKEDVILLFTDTKIEDDDLYRFIQETSNKLDVELIVKEDTCNLGKIFNFDRVTLNQYLDLLKEEGFIDINRTAGLDQVYINFDKIKVKSPYNNKYDILKYYYENEVSTND